MWPRRARRGLRHDKKMLVQQKRIAFWTCAYFWVTVTMAIGALAAAILTGIYVHTTKQLLEQAQKDSKIASEAYESATKSSQADLRPYVIANVEEARLTKISNQGNSVHYALYVRVIYTNSGKTPALNFRCASGIRTYKNISEDEKAKALGKMRESEVYSGLLGIVRLPVDKTFDILIPPTFTTDRKAYLIAQNESLPFYINDLQNKPLYFFAYYEYTDLSGTTSFAGSFVCCLLTDLKNVQVIATSDSYDMN